MGLLQVNTPLWPKPSWNLRGRVLKFTCLDKPTVFTCSKEGGLKLAKGYLADVIQEMQLRLNFTPELIPTSGFGSLTPNGSWNGMVGVIAKGEAEVAPLDFTPSLDRQEVVDFSLPLGQDVVVIMAQAPNTLVKPFLLLQIFSLQMWACVMGGAVLGGVVMATLRQEGGLLGTVKERMIDLSGQEIGSWDFFKLVADGTYALVDTYSSAVGRAQVFEQRGGRCLFHLARWPVKVDLDTIAYAKNSFVRTQFDEIIRWFKYYGIIEKLKAPHYSISCEASHLSDHPDAMTLHQTQGIFYVLAAGLFFSALTLLTEILVFTLNTKAVTHGSTPTQRCITI
ncbi:Glutamate receptor ionotropic, delta-2-like 18 [Homarus americanus]|uniref:Glutamate receptor ionotropic, delta-2-like 18 n=1 Tax=Homarus americanus TaxID=6706 RepID=A0A8J5NDJ9_HOMAM|nr:Glutamate receptor ionotropic, delta-2-like 18 [Homarus americanus]